MHTRVRQNGFNLGGKDQGFVAQAVVQRLNSNPVPRQKQRLRIVIPNREGKHATQLLQAFGTQFLVKVNNHLRIRLSLEGVPFTKQDTPQLLIVIDLPIENDPDRAVLIREWLVASAEVNDGQPAMAQANLVSHVESLVVRPAVANRLEHGLNKSRFNVRALLKTQFSA